MAVANVRVRPFETSDAAACAQLFYDAVHQLTGQFYTKEQRLAWAPEVMSESALCHRLRDQFALVAEDERGVLGFMSYHPSGELDFAYVRPDCAGKGVALQLHDGILQIAREQGAVSLRTFASELARRFFERRGWNVQERHDFEKNGVPIHNYKMWIDL